MSHTPGPWTIERSPVRGVLCVTSPAAWICGEIANPNDPLPPGEPEANAHLIAAAPDMLAALKKFVAAYDMALVRSDPIDFAHEAAVAAIAKAEGRS